MYTCFPLGDHLFTDKRLSSSQGECIKGSLNQGGIVVFQIIDGFSWLGGPRDRIMRGHFGFRAKRYLV